MAHNISKTPDYESSEDVLKKKEVSFGQDALKKRGRPIRNKTKLNDSTSSAKENKVKVGDCELNSKAGADMAQHLSTKQIQNKSVDDTLSNQSA